MSHHCLKNSPSLALQALVCTGSHWRKTRLELSLGDAAPAVGPLDLLQGTGEVAVSENLAEGDVADSRAIVRG